MKDQVSKRETGFLARFAAFMLAAFMMISFFPTNASALSQEITVHQAEGDFIELWSGSSYSNSTENGVFFSVDYNSQYTVSTSNGSNAYGETVTHKYTGDNYVVGAVLYGNVSGRWQQVSWISSTLGGSYENEIYGGYYHTSGDFYMTFPKTDTYSSYKLVIGMADLSTQAYGLPFTDIYATNTYEFKMGQRINEGSSGSSDIEEKTVSLDLYQPFLWDGIGSVSVTDSATRELDYSFTDNGVLFIPTSSGNGTYRITDGSGKIYKLNYTISGNIYSGAVIDEGTRNMKYGDTDVFVTSIDGMTRFRSRFSDTDLDYDPSTRILSKVYGSEAQYQAVGIGSTKLIRTFYSGNNETGYNVHICRHTINVSNEGVMSVELSPSTLYLRSGDTYQLNVNKSFPDNADEITLGTSYSLTSYSPSIASVDDSGLVTAVSKGNTGIKCTTTQGISDSVTVNVDYEPQIFMFNSRVVELEKGQNCFTPRNWYNNEYYNYVGILSEKNFAPSVASISSDYIEAIGDGISTIQYVCGFNYNDTDTYYAPGVVTSKEQMEYIIKVGDTSGGGNTPTEPDTPDGSDIPDYSGGETPTYISPVISSDIISDNSNEVTIKNTTDLDIAYFKIDTDKLDGSLQIRINQSREASMRASGLIYDYAQSVGAKNYVYYPVNIDLYNTETKEEIHSLPDGAKITFYITVPEEMLPLKNRLKVFHINSDNEMEMLESRITRKGGSICVRFDMDEFSPVALYVDDLTDEQFEEISAAAGYVTSKDEVVYVDYVGSGAGLSNSGFFAMDRSEQTAVCICAFVMFTAVISVSVVAGKKSRKK